MKQHSPATARNRDPILKVLTAVLPATGTVLEIASGSGEHGPYFAHHLPGIRWQPSDRDPVALGSTAAWRTETGLDNVLPVLELDVTAANWPLDRADAIFCANLIHISPWACTLGLLDGAARTLDPGAPLVLYGPYKREGKHTAPSNARFEQWLQSQDPSWGVRNLETVNAEAEARGFGGMQVIEMPANNLSVVWRRR